MEKNYRKQPVTIVLITILILIGLSFLPKKIEVAGIELKYIDIMQDLKDTDADEYYENESQNADEFENNTVEASLNLPVKFTEVAKSFIVDEANKIAAFKNNGIDLEDVPITGNTQQMKYFYDALKSTKNSKVRVAHYGDSAIEGDNITSELRRNLQEKFGGKGVGFMAITSQDIRFRSTTKHSFSDTWDNASIFVRNPKNLPIGINGEVFVPKSKSWVEYYATGIYSSIRNFKEVRLFYSDAKNSKINYAFDGRSSESSNLESGSKVNELTMSSKRSVRKIKIEMPEAKQAYFYGASLENGNGIYVDNFPLRGNSGVSLLSIPDEKLQEFSGLLNYKLMIFYFGLNVVTSKKSNFHWYEKEMVKVINKFKKVFPQTSFLIVSVSDKSIKRGSRFMTNPAVPKLVKVQENIAKETNIAFWNLYEAMGGKNAMYKWVKANPPLATKDYTHFTLSGSKKVGELLTNVILKEYK